MKLAIIADVHSNLQALEAVLLEIERTGAGIIVCAGDIVGYGGNPNECCRLVEQVAGHAVLGNHDSSALTRDVAWMNPFAATAAIWTSHALDNASARFLGSLQVGTMFDFGDKKCAMFHGSPRATDEYVFEEQANEEMLSGSDVLVLGHTHIPFVKKFRTGVVVNPGSVGQPRDGDPRASFGVYDTDEDELRINRLEYDIEGAANAIILAGLPRMLAARLFEGR